MTTYEDKMSATRVEPPVAGGSSHAGSISGSTGTTRHRDAAMDAARRAKEIQG